MQTYNNLYNQICSYKNIYLAYRKARKGKSNKKYVKEFEKDLQKNLILLQNELVSQNYKPRPLKTFIIHDPKLRKISKSEFVDRIVHHALVNILEPIYEKIFIPTSYANRKDKGNFKAIKDLKKFIKKVTKNNKSTAYFLKADIKKYFENIDHEILLNIIRKKIKDEKVLLLIRKIIYNVSVGGGDKEIGMPLGNLTSQFFANVYLNELDYYVKYDLRIKYCLRYVDDFIILHNSEEYLIKIKYDINSFLRNDLKLELHEDKSKIFNIDQGIPFLGFRHFFHYSIPRKNKRKYIKNKIKVILEEYEETQLYDIFMQRIESTFAHLEFGDTYNLRKKLVNQLNRLINSE